MDLQKLKFPIGEYKPNKKPNPDLLNRWINEIEEFPSKLEEITKNISVEELNWNYRPNGWTVKQVIHHCADSHMNSIIRFKLALTEDIPVIRPYFEDRWADLMDYQDNDIIASMTLIKGLHKKWVVLLKALTKDQLDYEFTHPAHGERMNLAETIGNYAWHCNHHLAHIKNGIESDGKYH